ncbi:hypothetical protein [Parabacteroides provencensis]|uniref:hypothetical protein n=1 Tax=Parabacteroides provencensis TaxID=1944636 RepID=UPI001E4E5D37|nr:hypothetical protein [Parabacteroides provencensis]
MVQIEELGKVIAQLIFNRNSNGGGRNPVLIETVYTSLKLDRDFLLTTSIDDLRRFLDCEDSQGLSRMEIAAKTLIEDSYIQPDPNNKQTLLRAKELLEYIQKHDSTFSLERIALMEQINGLLST